MKISVIVATYNRPDALRRVLEGLSAQRQPPSEVIVADDGSGPKTGAVISQASRNADFPVRHVWQADRGFRVARIRNRAVAAASGDYLVFLDGDCIPDGWFVFDHAALALPGTFFQGTRVLVGRRRAEDFGAKDAPPAGSRVRLLLSGGLGNRHHLLRFSGFPARRSRRLSGIRSCNLGMFRNDLATVNGFNEAFEGWGREDSELAVRLFRFGLWRRAHPFRAVCFHLWHPENRRDRLSTNDRLLREAIASDRYDCDRGLFQNRYSKKT
ncbi:MAG: glycosyltransferase family 2 protein [Desulfococcaceae bacterium]